MCFIIFLHKVYIKTYFCITFIYQDTTGSRCHCHRIVLTWFLGLEWSWCVVTDSRVSGAPTTVIYPLGFTLDIAIENSGSNLLSPTFYSKRKCCSFSQLRNYRVFLECWYCTRLISYLWPGVSCCNLLWMVSPWDPSNIAVSTYAQR